MATAVMVTKVLNAIEEKNHYSHHVIFQKMSLDVVCYDIPFNILPMYRLLLCTRILMYTYKLYGVGRDSPCVLRKR